MNTVIPTTGSVPDLFGDTMLMYHGDLRPYFKVICNAPNVNAPYHNLGHMLHVAVMCYTALIYYFERERPICIRDARNLIIASLFHDYNHSAGQAAEQENIQRAIHGFMSYCMEEDVPYGNVIRDHIRETTYPHTTPTEKLCLCGQILRDADMSMSLSPVWIQRVVVGLASENRTSFEEMLRRQIDFHERLTFHTEWGQYMFRDATQKKLHEAKRILKLYRM